ncbi:mitochondrial import inner membrane translocase subunit TIM22-4-like [Carpediemonas membranifera]|uniref:Mitochondrial import inner membrane translocase subunit TIM22-4-like n=1 Tax=Carpediemonas membranifera TaxID=201153 RepID=A0A8J6E803_9EUKA|nr:mitochondrial import inner membrane translocase subunit TIM22-4-like [Carpediemonas membranifera]|eukprot:KAG9391270.1 mitochondrial import inner membrane translocase subunit TIM22-4-like [Carpediemonas membranifera]
MALFSGMEVRQAPERPFTKEERAYLLGQRLMSPDTLMGQCFIAFMGGVGSGLMGGAYGVLDGAMKTLIHHESLGARGFGRLMWQHSRSFATLTWIYNGSKLAVDHGTQSRGMANTIAASAITGTAVGWNSFRRQRGLAIAGGMASRPAFPVIATSFAEYTGFSLLSEVFLSEDTVLSSRLSDEANDKWAALLSRARRPLRKLTGH